MGGGPERQVRAALKHIIGMANLNKHVKLVMLSYGSDCKTIHSAEEYRIDGGTNFRAAYAAIRDVIARHTCSDDEQHALSGNNVGSVTIAFLTDGEDTCGRNDTLVSDFKAVLPPTWPLTVHTIGFSRGCDQTLLENMRLAGSIPGLFRYA